ncbi:MAG: tRNA-dependent cyclodipeptide synthase [Planctomycetota bacterium]|jgi:tRNA-dependent cyclodipeptide synthase
MILGSNSKNPDLPSVRIAKIIPKISKQELFSYKRCYIGISLGNPDFEGKSLSAILDWMVDRFGECLVVVGDHLCRYNELILNGLKEEQAAKVVNGLGDLFVARTKKQFEELPDGKIHLTRWKSHLETDQYRRSKAILDTLFSKNSEFRATVEKDAVSFVRRHIKRNQTLAVQPGEALRLCCEYLLEEIAVFSALSEQGWRVELYPGSELSVLVDIASGKYLKVPKGLKERVSVELKIGGNSLRS